MQNPSEFSIAIGADGVATMVYDDLHAEFMKQGGVSVCRASHVEPVPYGRWTADMSPVGGPLLGPFDLRADALRAEIQYLKQLLF